MGTKLLWTGATLILPIPAVAIVSAVVMVIGLVLTWLDK